MFLTAHATIGALLGQQVSSSLTAFILGFVSHFIVDLIPHGDEGLSRRHSTRRRYVAKIAAITVLDGGLLASLILLWFTNDIFANPVPVAWAIFGAILPDVLQGITELTDHRFLSRYQRFHHLFHIGMHPRWSHVRLPFTIGLPLQILFWMIIQRSIGS